MKNEAISADQMRTIQDAASYAWMRLKGFASWQAIRWFTAPIDWQDKGAGRRLWFSIYCRLMGNAYTADNFPSFALWRDYRLPLRTGRAGR